MIWRLRWTPLARIYIGRHEVVADEVEEVCAASPVYSATYGGRMRLIGATRAGRMLTVILEPLDGQEFWFPVTARTASRKERILYFQERA